MISTENNIPIVNGLILAGGKSERMGTAKDRIHWHGKEQRYFAADLLQYFCEQVYISCRLEQVSEINQSYDSLPDTFLNMGPMGGMLSAFRVQPDRAWLIVACDLPLLSAKTLDFLLRNRDYTKLATTFESSFDGKPEPLIAIWEPCSYNALLQSLGEGITCPRRVLLNHEIRILKPLDDISLMNVNTPKDAEIAKAILAER